MKKNFKIGIYSEVCYIISIFVLAFAVCLVKASDFGMSMIVAPAYILSTKISFLSFGMGEYLIQGILFIIFCIVMKKIRAIYFVSFGTSVIYGFLLDFFGQAIPLFNPEVVAPETIPFALRILLFVLGCILTTFAVALSFHTYILPQMVDFFVNGITKEYGLKLNTFKTAFDLSYLTLSVILSFLFFGQLQGIGIGTLILALSGGVMIGFFDKLISKYCEIKPASEKLYSLFKR